MQMIFQHNQTFFNMRHFLPCAFLFMFLISCEQEKSAFPGLTIPITLTQSQQSPSDKIAVSGFLTLNMESLRDFHHMDKVVFSANHIYVLDCQTDFHNVFIFDRSTGGFLGRAGRQVSDENAFESIRDMAVSGNGEVTLLGDAKRAFYNYTPDGIYRSKLMNGMIGDKLARASDGSYFVYNELSETPLTGNHRLMVYDAKGNLLKRMQPFDRRLENWGYEFSGFLSSSGDRIWYSPPFCDTIFEVQKQAVIPRFRLDFGQQSIPDDLRNHKLNGSELSDFGFLNERFVQIGHHVLFEYQLQDKIRVGLFDEARQAFSDMEMLKPDALSPLFRHGILMPKDQEEFALVLSPASLFQLQEKEAFRTELSALMPGLGEAVFDAKGQKALVVFCRFKP